MSLTYCNLSFEQGSDAVVKRLSMGGRMLIPMAARVGDIAKRYGFPETSRFAAAYRLDFGENPSVTLARLRNLRR